MVRPTAFYSNEETAEDNKFMEKVKATKKKTTEKAIGEFEAMVENLRSNGVEVEVYDQMREELPDSVFPNNWFSTHVLPALEKSIFIVYPMKAPSRQAEINPKVIQEVGGRYGQVLELKPAKKGQSLEGTGSLVIDSTNLIVYANLSERCSEATLKDYMKLLNGQCKPGQQFKLVKFRSFGKDGSPIYHTNVVMGLLARHAVVCLECVKDEKERKGLRSALEKSGKAVIEISYEEMGEMCGNIIQVKDKEGNLCVIMSKRALDGFSKENKKALKSNYKLIVNKIPTIERIGGGSARCMVAELYE